MEFLFDHDGRTYVMHTECREQETTQALCDEVFSQQQPEAPLEPSGDDE